MKKIRLTSTEALFITLLLVFGIPMIVLIPPGAGYDEEDHLVRVWELSMSSLIPGQLSPREMQYPLLFRDFAYRQQGSLGIVEPDFWQKYGRAGFYDYGIARREIDTKSVYSPALLLPQAIILRLFGRDTGLPALFIFYACRFGSLLSYLLLVVVAIRLIPSGKWILMVLALAPMAVFQAATISPDAISNGIGFLFIAGILRIAQSEAMGWRQATGLVTLIFLLYLAKLNLIPLVLLPFLIIRPARFTEKRLYISVLASTVILFILEVAAWNLIAASRSDPLMANDADPTGQILYIVSYPLTFILNLLKDLVTNGWMYFQGWINGYGYYYWMPPLLITVLFLLGLGAALQADSTRVRIDSKERLAFVLVFLAGYLATILSIYLTFTPPGVNYVLGVQGRYFTVLALLIFLVFASLLKPKRTAVPSSRWISLPVLSALVLNVLGIYLSFHVPCGETFYQTGLCYRPLSRDLSETHPSPPISEGVSLAQEIQVRCDGMAEVRVLWSPSSPGEPSTVRLILEDPLRKHALLDTVVASDQVSTGDWYPVRFDPDWHSAGKQYVLRILGVDAPAGQGLQVLYTSQSEFDLGTLHESGQAVDDDIALQYGCAAGLGKIWLTGKP